jgi:hypothetical protein
MRSKQVHSQEKDDRGKTVIRKLGEAPIQRDGMEYEFTTVFDVAIDHKAAVSKDRTGLFDGQFFQITEETGQQFMGWLNSATGEAAPVGNWEREVTAAPPVVAPRVTPGPGATATAAPVRPGPAATATAAPIVGAQQCHLGCGPLQLTARGDAWHCPNYPDKRKHSYFKVSSATG